MAADSRGGVTPTAAKARSPRTRSAGGRDSVPARRPLPSCAVLCGTKRSGIGRGAGSRRGGGVQLGRVKVVKGMRGWCVRSLTCHPRQNPERSKLRTFQNKRHTRETAKLRP